MLSKHADSPYVSLLGGAMTHDAHHVTSVDPARTQVDQCVKLALSNAGVTASEVRYMNAHGPGTQQCDTAEAGVLDELLEGGRRSIRSNR